MKTYLISLTSDCHGVSETYLKTIEKVEDSVIPIMVAFLPYPKDIPRELSVFTQNVGYAGNMNRFKFFPKGIEDDDMVIFTDASDVIFQGRIPKLEQKIYVCPEFANYDESSWFHSQFEPFNFHALDGTPIYNMGTWAMPYKKAKEMFQFLFDNWNLFPNWHCADQPLYNLWLQNQEFETHPTLMTCLFNSLGTGKAVKTDKGWVNPDNELYTIVHSNGNKGLLF